MVALVVASLVVLNIIPFFEKDSYATAGANITKTSTTDFDQGTNSNTNTSGDEMKMMPNPRTAWYSTGGTWSYRKKIIIDHTKVPNTDQTDFPVLINLASDSDLASKAQDDGDDILLTQEDQTTKLSHEIESFNGTTGALVLWVKIPLLSATYDTTVYMYYGNASATSQQSATAVWSNGYLGVYHLGDPTNPTSSTGSNNGTNIGTTATTGQIGGGANLNGSQYINTALAISPAQYSSLSMFAWIKPSTVVGGNTYRSIVAGDDGGWDRGFGYTNSVFQVQIGTAGWNATSPSIESWQYVGVVYTPTSVTFYKNGTAFSYGSAGTFGTSAQAFQIGEDAGCSAGQSPGCKFPGAIDNTHVSSTARSADWIATEYANQNAPASFYSVQSETAKTSVNIASNNISTDWYTINSTVQTDWKYRRQITIDHTKVPNTDQSEFPMLVKIADATDSIFTKAQADGDDILFTNAYGSTKLSHEIETFNTTTKEFWAWVKIPTLKTATDTTIWLYYGNASATSQQNKTDVWSNGYNAVWHLKETGTGAAGDYKDSAINAINSNNTAGQPSASAGKVNGGQTLNGGSQQITFPYNASLNNATGFSISGWVKPNTNDGRIIIGKPFANTHTNPYLDWGLFLDTGRRIQFRIGHSVTDNNNAIPFGSWSRVVATADGANWKWYINGALDYSLASSALPTNTNSQGVRIGSNANNGELFTGGMDEFNISSAARSADWIATEYANQNAPETFASISKESGYYPAASSATWYGEGGAGQKWAYRQKITIDKTKVPNTNQTDFPVLIKITDANNGIFAKAQSDGDDIVFAGSDQYTKLSHEIETFNTSTKELWAWVKVPTLSTSTNTVLYLYYGNPNSASQQNKTGVWTNGYAGVWHMGDGSSLVVTDSTSKGNNLTNNNSTAGGGKINGGAAMPSATLENYLATSASNSWWQGPLTISGWFKSDTVNGNHHVIAGTGRGSAGWTMQASRDSDHKLQFGGYTSVGGVVGVGVSSSATVTGDGLWHYATGTISPALVGTLFKDGQSQGTVNNFVPVLYNDPFYIGRYMGGNVDEVRFSSVSRSADWVATEYNNQNNPATFYTLESEVADPGTGEWFPARGTWSARQAVTIDKTKVPNTNQIDFPVLVKITNQSNGVFAGAQADGDDILFTSSDGKTKLSHEIETYTTTAGSKALWAWVKVPTLSTSTDTVLYMYYGNASANSQQNVTDVWSNGYAAVYHTNEASGPVIDSTVNSFNSTAQSLTYGAGGKVNKSYSLNGSSDYASGTGLNIAGSPFTVSYWQKPNSYSTATQAFSLGSSGGSDQLLHLRNTSDTTFRLGMNGDDLDVTVSNMANRWNYSAVSLNSSRLQAVYWDGSFVNSRTATGMFTGNGDWAIGKWIYFGGEKFYGLIDEVRVSSTARSADWIATEYNNQNSPETFESFGMEQSNVSYASPTSTTAGAGIIDTTWNGGWGTPNGFTSLVTIPTNTSINFQMRSSVTGGAVDNDWTAWADLGTATTTGTFAVTAANMPASITTGTNRYIQTRAVLASTDGSATPALSDYTVSYLADTTTPTNPSTTTLTIEGAAQTTSTWTSNSGVVVATFSGSSDGAAGESGLAGYYVYFGTDYSADPLTAGAYQAHSGAVGDNQTYSSSISTSDDGKYYSLRIKTKDVAGNISPAATTFEFGYDISAPTRPSFISANPAGYTTNNSFSFTWPAGADVKTAGGWYSSSWSSRQQVTFDHTKVPNTDQTDFPVLVKITDANNELFTTAKSNGYDILFTSVNGTTKLSHEIEKYDATTKELWAWVKVPLLSHETDTKIYMYYGNAAATNQQTAADVWSNGYAGVWHMGEASGNVMDSTANDNDGAVRGTPTFSSVGQVGKAVALTAKSQYFVVSPTVNFPYGSSDRTLSVWVKPTEDTFWGHIFHYGTPSDTQVFGIVRLQSALAVHQWHEYSSYGNVAMNQYQLLTIKVTGGNTRNFYINGALVGTDTKTINTISSDTATIGTIIYQGEDGIRGLIDEPRISSTARSADWIAAEYANQNSPETFMTVSPSNGGSDIKWYEYKRATDNDWSHTADAATRSISGIASYREGANAFYVRSVDNAGNVSSNYQQVTYYYSGVAPAKPDSLTVSPETSDSNSFTLHWHKPAVGAGDPPVVGYYYSINATPTISNVTYIASQADEVSVGASPFATLQGVNTVYVVSVNSAGNLSYEPEFIASTTFTCVTPAPAIPASVSLYDSSDRTLDRWMLTTQWVAGSTQGAGAVDHYNIERSTNGIDFTHLANSTSNAYIDASGLSNSTTYSYRIKAVDSAGKESAPSSIVSKMPTGKYLVSPAIISAPAVTKIKSNEATVSWTTDRASTSVIRYAGATPQQATPLFGTALTLSTGNFDSVTSHAVTVLGLNPSTKYYFEVQSMDEDRDYDPETAYSTTYNFSTLDAPAISDVTIENITLTTADISFKTTTVANSSIHYGTSTTYNKSIEDKSGEGTTSHKVKLTELATGTLHHFKIQGTDIDGNKLTSDDYSFKTLEPPRAESITATPIDGEPSYTLKITWQSNVETTTVLKYTAKGGDTKESVSSKLSKDHEVIIKELQDNTTYAISATGRDQFGNEAIPNTLTIETPADSRPPKIDSLSVESNINGSNADSKSQIVISWHTDEPSTSQVEYGEGTGAEGYGSSSQEYTNLASDHLVILSDLDNQKPYHIRAVSKDASGNAAYSENTVVVTKKPRQAAFTLIVDTLAKSFRFLSKILRF